MLRTELREHKRTPKKMATIPKFKGAAKKIQKPFKFLGGKRRIQVTDFIDVSATHVAFFYWRDGQILTDTSFFAYLFCRLANGSLSPIFALHWHPSHKGIHCETPCDSQYDYTDRMLPGAKELSLLAKSQFGTLLDPRKSDDRLRLIFLFCKACGITLPDSDSNSETLW
jgi:hypothetical protein